jgi:aspartyl-tRNA(Asn)/glutamyl-tRNA(Gln) amidotransferase subunit A
VDASLAAGARPASPLAGVPLALKDVFTTTDMPTTAGSRILEGWRPPYDATVTARLRAAGRHDPRQDQHGRVRDGLLHRALGLRPTRNPWDPPGPRRVRRRVGRRAGRLRGPARDRHRHRRLDPAAGRVHRHRRRQADLRRRLPLRAHRLRVVAGPGRAVRAHRAGRGAAARGDRRVRPARLHLDRLARARRRRGRPGGRPRRPDRRARRRRPRAGRRGLPAGRPRGVRRVPAAAWRSWAPTSSRCPARTSSTGSPRTT